MNWSSPWKSPFESVDSVIFSSHKTLQPVQHSSLQQNHYNFRIYWTYAHTLYIVCRLSNNLFKFQNYDALAYIKQGLILGLYQANERCRYKMTPSPLAGCKPNISPVICMLRSQDHVLIHWLLPSNCYSWHAPLDRYVKLRVAHAPGCRERFPCHYRLAIPTCITARAWRTYRDACRDR